MAGPQNGIIGDDYGIEIAQTQMPPEQLVEEKKAARYSKTAEFKRLAAHMESRIEFYQNWMPGGEAVIDPALQGHRWAVANSVISEFKAVLNFYETAAETVKEAEKN